MTPEQLDDIEARADAASTWPWEWAGRDLESAEGAVIATSVDCMPYCYGGTARMEMSHEDNEFLLHARADVPALVAEVRRLREVLQDLADYGTRHDLNPTQMNAEGNPVTWWLGYMQSMDQHVRTAARSALDRKEQTA